MEGDNNPRPGTLLSESILYHETDDNKRNDSIDSEDFKQSDDSSIADCSKLSVGDRSGGGLSQNSGQRRGLVHSVSIVVEPANNMDDSDLDDQIQIAPTVPIERRKTIAGPIVVLEDFYFDQPKKGKEYDDIVQSLFASARVRKEEFARLLEEHAQIVNEINKAETSLP